MQLESSVAESLYAKRPYAHQRGLREVPIGLNPNILVVHVHACTFVKEVSAYAKANPASSVWQSAAALRSSADGVVQ